MVDQSSSSSEAKSGAVSGIMRNRPGSVRPQAINIQAIDAEYESNNPYSKTTTKTTTTSTSYTGAASSSPSTSTTPLTAASTPSSSSSSNTTNVNVNVVTPSGIRGKTDIRSPGAKQTPQTENTKLTVDEECTDAPPVPSFITQTDQYGRATTPRIAHNNGVVGVSTGVHSAQQIKQTDTDDTEDDKDSGSDVDPCDTLLESLRMMCCCILPDGGAATSSGTTTTTQYVDTSSSNTGKNSPTVYPDRYSMNENQMSSIKLLKNPLKKDQGKKCLVLDLDETLVHSSFRAVSGADFVIPVQIEDVVHFVYVAKRPGVDKFLSEMAKHFEIVVYTASLNKYADPLLDLLDPKGHIRYRLFRESCVYYDGNYVKDLSLINRDLSQSIIVDNSPASYIFHPDNAIDCSSFIDDPSDRELDQIGSFLVGVRDVKDVRKVCNMWREWPLIPHVDGLHFPPQGGDNGGHGSGVVLDARDEQCPR